MRALNPGSSVTSQQLKEVQRMGKVSPTAAIYEDPDQEAVRRDLALLFGPRSDYYLKEYEGMRQRKVAGETLRPS